MYPDKIFGLFTLYGLLIGLGILAAFMVIWKLAKIGKVEDKFVDFTSIALVVAVAVGFFFAMVFQSLYEWIELRQTLPDAPFVLNTGMTFLGGLIGGVACYIPIYFIFRKKFEGRFIDIITILPVALTLAHGFGRFGCFTAGCCYGAEATGPLAFLGIEFVTTPGVRVWPTQLFEAIFLLILSAIMLILYIKKRFPHNMSVYLIAYGVFRFLIEYIRGDDRGELIPGSGVSPSQWISIFMVVIGIVLIIFMAPMFKKRKEYLLAHPIQETPENKSKKGSKKSLSSSSDETIVGTNNETTCKICSETDANEPKQAGFQGVVSPEVKIEDNILVNQIFEESPTLEETNEKLDEETDVTLSDPDNSEDLSAEIIEPAEEKLENPIEANQTLLDESLDENLETLISSNDVLAESPASIEDEKTENTTTEEIKPLVVNQDTAPSTVEKPVIKKPAEKATAPKVTSAKGSTTTTKKPVEKAVAPKTTSAKKGPAQVEKPTTDKKVTTGSKAPSQSAKAVPAKTPATKATTTTKTTDAKKPSATKTTSNAKATEVKKPAVKKEATVATKPTPAKTSPAKKKSNPHAPTKKA